MAVNPPKPYCHTNKREIKCMAIRPPMPNFHINKRQMYGSQSTQAILIRDRFPNPVKFAGGGVIP